MRIQNLTQGTELASDAREPRGMWGRAVGLLGRSSLRPGEALILQPCTSIHTAFMRFPIDVVYVDRSDRVAKVCPNVKPFRISGILRGGHTVLELPSGTLADSATAVGDQLSIES